MQVIFLKISCTVMEKRISWLSGYFLVSLNLRTIQVSGEKKCVCTGEGSICNKTSFKGLTLFFQINCCIWKISTIFNFISLISVLWMAWFMYFKKLRWKKKKSPFVFVFLDFFCFGALELGFCDAICGIFSKASF